MKPLRGAREVDLKEGGKLFEAAKKLHGSLRKGVAYRLRASRDVFTIWGYIRFWELNRLRDMEGGKLFEAANRFHSSPQTGVVYR